MLTAQDVKKFHLIGVPEYEKHPDKPPAQKPKEKSLRERCEKFALVTNGKFIVKIKSEQIGDAAWPLLEVTENYVARNALNHAGKAWPVLVCPALAIAKPVKLKIAGAADGFGLQFFAHDGKAFYVQDILVKMILKFWPRAEPCYAPVLYDSELFSSPVSHKQLNPLLFRSKKTGRILGAIMPLWFRD